MRRLTLPLLSLAILAACSTEKSVRVVRTAPAANVEAPAANMEAPAANMDSSAKSLTTAPSSSLEVETPSVYAADLLPPSMIAGPQFEVSPNVTMKGHMAGFYVKSDYGRLDADSVELLEQRIVEVAALAQLEKMSEAKVFGKAAATSAKNTGKALYNVFRNPEATAKAIPDAVKNKVASTWDAIKLKTKELSDDARGKIRGDDAPPEFNAFLADPPTTPEKTWRDRAQSQGTKFGLNYIGYNRARRELTRELQVDPYTSNPQIEDRLDAFAWSYLAGSAGTNIAIGAITGGAGFIVSKASKINKLVYDLPPEDIEKRNREELKKIGLKGEDARNFLRNSTFTPTLQTALVDHIMLNWEAQGWPEVLRYLRFVDSEIEARFWANALSMMQSQVDAGSRYVKVELVGVNPVFHLADGRVIVPAPVDYLHHNAKFKAFLGEPQLRGKTVELRVSGISSDAAFSALRERDWQFQQRVSFFGAPQYAPAEVEAMPPELQPIEPPTTKVEELPPQR